MGVLAVERREGWVLLTLDRPEKKNALSIELRDAVTAALDEAAADESVVGVAITGRDDIFSAGWDLAEFGAAAEDGDLMERIWASGDRFHHTLLTFPLPLVAAVNGPALAGAFDLAACCDVRIAATTARFAHPERTWADLVCSPFDALVPGAVARDVLLAGLELDAAEAHRVGFVSRVVEPAALPALLDEVMAKVAAVPREVQVRNKRKLVRRANIELLPTLEL
jgi:enoyl-CoA hydratase/carnithine racemase